MHGRAHAQSIDRRDRRDRRTAVRMRSPMTDAQPCACMRVRSIDALPCAHAQSIARSCACVGRSIDGRPCACAVDRPTPDRAHASVDQSTHYRAHAQSIDRRTAMRMRRSIDRRATVRMRCPSTNARWCACVGRSIDTVRMRSRSMHYRAHAQSIDAPSCAWTVH